MEKYNVMKKILFLAIICFQAVSPVLTTAFPEVSMRFGRQESGFRIVLESDDVFIKNANTIASLSNIRIEFPSSFTLQKPRDFIFETHQKDRFLYIKLTGVVDVRMSKLSGPARLVIDLKTEQKQKELLPSDLRQQQTQKQEQARPGEGQQKGSANPAQRGPLVSPLNGAKTTPSPTPQAGAGTTPSPPSQPGVKTAPSPAPQAAVEKVRRVKIVVIDPGHGGYDYGIISKDVREKDVDLALSRELGNALAKRGKSVVFTRRADQYVPLTDRINYSNSKNPDLFISVHSSLSNSCVVNVSLLDDANADAALKLFTLFSRQGRHIARSREIAKAIAGAMSTGFGREVVLRELPLPALTSMNAPAILIEYPSVKSVKYDQKTTEKFITSMLKGIAAYEQ